MAQGQFRAELERRRAQRAEAETGLRDQQVADWASIAEGSGLSTQAIAHLMKMGATREAGVRGSLEAEERAFIANFARAEAERKKAHTRNLITGIGTGVGALAGGLLTLPAGGVGAGVGAAFGGSLGQLLGGAVTGGGGEAAPAAMVQAASTWAGWQYQRQQMDAIKLWLEGRSEFDERFMSRVDTMVDLIRVMNTGGQPSGNFNLLEQEARPPRG